MKSKRNVLAGAAKAGAVLPLLFILWIIAAEFIKLYGLVIIPVGAFIYLAIFAVVHKYFSKQSEKLEKMLERKLASASEKLGRIKKPLKN